MTARKKRPETVRTEDASVTRGTTWAAGDPFEHGDPYACFSDAEDEDTLGDCEPPSPLKGGRRSDETGRQSPDSTGLHGGRRVGQIRLIRLLGRGGMGKVYEGFDEALRRRVAVKTIHSGHRFSRDAKARFHREAQVLSKLDHPGICRIYNLIEEEDADYLVLELIDGSDLAEIADTLSFETKLETALGIAEALAAAHAAQIVHRDLKPENVMLNAEGQVKVLDFGISRSLTNPESRPEGEDSGWAGPELTVAGSLIGTLRYMSPEQAAGESVTAATDLYSFGVMLQELFAGRRAYDCETFEELLGAVRRAETAEFSGVDPELTQLIGELLSVDPEARPIASEAAARLRHRLERPLRQRRRAWLTAVAAMVLIAMLATAFAAHRAATPSPWLETGGRILLLPFANATGDPELSWVEHGLASMVAQNLSELEQLDLVPFGSVTQKLQADGLEGESLNAGHIESLVKAFKADIAIATRAELQDSEYSLAYTAYRPATGRSDQLREHQVRAGDLTQAAAQLGRRLGQRLAPGSVATPMADQFSDDPFLNRLYAMGVERLRQSGPVACSYFRICLDQDPSFLRAREMLAECLSAGGKYDEAGELWSEVMEQARERKDPHLEGVAALDLGMLANRRGQWPEAEEFLSLALNLFEKNGNAYFTANTLIAFSELRSRLGQTAEAEEFLQRALKISEEEEDDELMARSLHALGVAKSARWEIEPAIELLQRALELERTVGLRHLQANTLNSLGNLLPYVERFEEAREALLESQTLARRLENPAIEGMVTSNLGNLELHRSNLELAASYFASAVEIFEELNNPAQAAYPALNLAIALGKMERYDEGRESLELAIEQFLPDDPVVIFTRGLYAYGEKDYARSVALLEQAKELNGLEAWTEEDELLLERSRKARARR